MLHTQRRKQRVNSLPAKRWKYSSLLRQASTEWVNTHLSLHNNTYICSYAFVCVHVYVYMCVYVCRCHGCWLLAADSSWPVAHSTTCCLIEIEFNFYICCQSLWCVGKFVYLNHCDDKNIANYLLWLFRFATFKNLDEYLSYNIRASYLFPVMQFKYKFCSVYIF